MLRWLRGKCRKAEVVPPSDEPLVDDVRDIIIEFVGIRALGSISLVSTTWAFRVRCHQVYYVALMAETGVEYTMKLKAEHEGGDAVEPVSDVTTRWRSIMAEHRRRRLRQLTRKQQTGVDSSTEPQPVPLIPACMSSSQPLQLPPGLQRVLITGLVGAGKSALLESLRKQLRNFSHKIAMPGFENEVIGVASAARIIAFDLDGYSSRNAHLAASCSTMSSSETTNNSFIPAPRTRDVQDGRTAVIFVVDSREGAYTKGDDGTRESDTAAHSQSAAARALASMVSEPSLAKAKLLILANKQDCADAVFPEEIAKRLDLDGIEQDWCVQGCSVRRNQGIRDGVAWLWQNEEWKSMIVDRHQKDFRRATFR